MSCVTTISISILINGKPIPFFQPSRGIRQGDPLSPYLFIICMESLSRIIEHDVDIHKWTSVHNTRNAPPLSHLLFVDDLILLAHANLPNTHNIINIFNQLSEKSGQGINFLKSKTFFSANVDTNSRQTLTHFLTIPQITNFGKYLGLPITTLQLKSNDYQYILDRITTKLVGWRSKFLTLAGRATLINSVLDFILVYAMQNNILPPKNYQRT